jgi:hypothetical protein
MSMSMVAPALVTALGVTLMVVQIIADSEPGALPLALVLVGVGWFTTRVIRNRRNHQQPD